jgi:hypothetical protein
MKKQKDEVNKVVDGPYHCIHCDEDPCVFIQIESRLCEDDEIYFDEGGRLGERSCGHATAEGVNVHTSMQRSFYGKASTIGNLTTGALKMVFGYCFLPSVDKSWVANNQVKLVLLCDCNSVNDKNSGRRQPLKN